MLNTLDNSSGAQWDTDVFDVIIPSGVGTTTLQLFSEAGVNTDSFLWEFAALRLPVDANTSTLQIEKFWNGAEAADFEFLVEGADCYVDVGGEGIDPEPVFVAAGETFTLPVTPPGPALAVIFCDGTATITEQPGDGFTIVEPVTCNSVNATVEGASVTYDFPDPGTAAPETVLCLFTNEEAADGNLTVTKVCPAGPGEATFKILVDGDANIFACGTSLDYPGLPAGDVTISEIISGSDSGNFVTSIDCDNGEDAAGTSLTFALEGGDDVSCDVINIFTGDGLTEEEILQLLLSLNRDLEIEIEIENELNNINSNINDNDNTNTNNLNENTQNQVNDQNTNVSVNVSSGGGTGTGISSGSGAITITPPNTGSAGIGSVTGSGVSSGLVAAAAGLLGTLSLAAIKLVGVRD